MNEKTKETERMLMEMLQKAKVEETPHDVANGSRGWDQADRTPGIDQLANDIGYMEALLADIEKEQEQEPEPVFDNPYDEPEEVEIRKLNRHERRKRAKLARMLAVKERLEMQKRQKPKVESEKENKNG